MGQSAVNYRVVWRQRTRQTLHALAFIARERGDSSDRILRAVEEIELRLALAPNAEGESREESERVLIVPPLSVRFEVFEAEQAVLIYSAVFYPRMPA